MKIVKTTEDFSKKALRKKKMGKKLVEMGLMMTTCDMKARGMPPYERPKERRNIT